MRSSWLVVCAVLALGSGAAAADDAFHPVPESPGLELRLVSYGQGVHGEMVVEVRNQGSASAAFVASGLYFTPDGNDEAQRVGMVGYMRVGSEGAATDAVTVAAGGVRKVRFDVYCIDEHRSAPAMSQAFTLASARMPRALRDALVERTAGYVAQLRKQPVADVTSLIQSEVWGARRQVKVRLQGERRERNAPVSAGRGR